MSESDNFIELLTCANDLFPSCRCRLLLIKQGFGNNLSRIFHDSPNLVIDFTAFLVDTFEHVQALNRWLQVLPLVQWLLGEFVNELNFLPVKVHVLHRIELGLELMQVRIELLGFVSDAGATARATGSLRRHGTGLRGLRRFCILVVGVELIDFVVDGI